jgi:hypothetical protein
MSDEFSRPGAQDGIRIDVNQDREIRFWCEQYEVSEVALRKAVAEVGVSAQHVADHLGKAPAAMRSGATGSVPAREARA